MKYHCQEECAKFFEKFTHFSIFVEQKQVCLEYRSHFRKWKEERYHIVEVVKTQLFYLFAKLIVEVQQISSAFLFGSDDLQMYTGFTFHLGDCHIELQVGKGNPDLSSQMVSIEADTFCTFLCPILGCPDVPRQDDVVRILLPWVSNLLLACTHLKIKICLASLGPL